MASKKDSAKKAGGPSAGGAKKRGTTDPTATAARRAAEAAAGLRHGRQVWFVLRNDEPHRLQTHYSQEDADSALSSSGAGYVKLGPYMTPAETATGKKKKIEWIKVKLVGDPKEYSLDPEARDALFWSVSALDKFLLPYYTMVYGPERAAEIRNQYLASDAAFECHDPISDPCNFP